MRCMIFGVCMLISALGWARTYEAQYAMRWSVGITLEADAVERLAEDGERYQIELSAEAGIGSATETTHLLFDPNTGWTPLDYSYTQSVLGRTTGRHFRFNWNKGTATRLHEPETAELEIPSDALDPLGFRLQLAHLLKTAQPLPTTITMLDGDDLKTRQLQGHGTEMIETPAGSFNALKFSLADQTPKPDKSFVFWLAPELDYQLIKLDKRDSKRRLALTLTSYQ